MKNYIILALVCIIIYIFLVENDQYVEFLYGFWNSNSTFNNNSNVENILLYFNNDNTGKITIFKDNEMILDENFTYNLSFNYFNIENIFSLYNFDDYTHYKINFNSKNEQWNGKFDLLLSINNGNIILNKDNIIYGNFFKNNLYNDELHNYINNNINSISVNSDKL